MRNANMSELFTITEPTVKTKKGMTMDAVIKTVKKNLQDRINKDEAVGYFYNRDSEQYAHACTVRYGVKPIKVFWAKEPIETQEKREEFANAVLDYIPNLQSVIWETYRTFSKQNRKNAGRKISTDIAIAS
tara:strand:- start:543 stop:935 length:393 start_codon:yes stop_codon:yes gene_type:complete